ncbi:hypothetical protein O181_066873 [Austropuccinia psidii MF-1]|uniref:MARVEL domain-containing protein n=1 Tax=Austropuccinia psidii MF-1 TaxID=1389203 RepID=A0A9Q3EXV7_9BASI|nr:hypothetical protein [Austropuccinia psidii MF-1]
MSNWIEKLKNADFTGLNRAFGKGKHSPKVPALYESRGISGGPLSSQNDTSRSSKGFGKINDNTHSSSSLLDDQDTSLIQVVIRGATLFFILINLFIYIAIAIFQKKWQVGPSGLTGLAIFVLLQGFLHALLLLCVPQIYERTDMLRGFARAIRLTRVQFIIYGTQTGLALLLSLTTTISAYSQGCKDPNQDPHASNKDYISHLGGFCRNKRAAAAFWWFSFLCFALSLAIVFKSWYSIRKLGPAHAAFEPPQGVGIKNTDDEEEETRADDHYYQSAANAFPQEMSTVRPSNVGGYYGERPVFDADRIPVGYGAPHSTNPPSEVIYNRPQNPATVPYKDPFDEIRAQIYQSGH